MDVYNEKEKKSNYNLDLALSCSNFLVSLKNKIGSMQFLKQRGRLLNELAAVHLETYWRSLIFEAVYPCWSVSLDYFHKSLVLSNLASLSCI